MTAFCEEADVRKALQKVELKGSISSEFVKSAIKSASDWFKRQTNGYWYDSGGGVTLVDSSTDSVTEVRRSLPASPHRQPGTIVSDKPHVQYPVTHDGAFAKVRLPHLHVSTLNKLEVRDFKGGVTDWVADSGFASGRDEDYYLQQDATDSYGRTYLYVNASSIGRRRDFSNILTLDYDYGLDYQTTPWDDVKRGIANLAAAELVDDDNVLAQVPDNGQLVGVQTQHQQLIDAAHTNLDPYISSVKQ